jgi:hypothetical protein
MKNALLLDQFLGFIASNMGISMGDSFNVRYYSQQFVLYTMDGVRGHHIHDNTLVAMSALNLKGE